MDFKYKDCKKEMDMVNRAFIETMIEGDANGRGFQIHSIPSSLQSILARYPDASFAAP